jgi:four helix bundle protein
MANQLFRSATSIGTNARKAQRAESKPGFIHKMKIADKAAYNWFMLCESAKNYPKQQTLLTGLNTITKVPENIIITPKA